jgi:glycine/D-amino acid oxidase-like deaminating enzyme
MAESADVVIVGGGIVGCATAYYLAKAGVRVVVCEKGRIGGEQSSRNWGFVRQQRRDPAELALMIEANRLWRGLEAELGADIEWRQGGNIALADTAARLAKFEAWAEVSRAHQLETRVIGPAELGTLIPGMKVDCVGAIYTPSDGQADPGKATAAFRDAAARLGAEFRTGRAVEGIERAGGRIAGVMTESGPISASIVVCAAGAWASRLLRGLGLTLPTIWMRGSVARTTPVPPITGAGVWSRVAFRQRRDGGLTIASGLQGDHDITPRTLRHGARFLPNLHAERKEGRSVALHLGRPFLADLAGASAYRRRRVLDPTPSGRLIAGALTDLKRAFPNLGDVRVAESWAGYIDMTPDQLPVIDRLDRPDGLVLATGFSGHGFGMGPIAGRLTAELVLDGRASMDIAALRFGRFGRFG